METNEAPEKLYVNFHFIETHPERHQPLVTKQGINKYDIEYTRTDAFIKKAVLYLIYNTSVVHYSFGDIREFKNNNFDEMLKDFENHMI